MSGFKLSGLWIFQDCQYARVVNFKGYAGFSYFCKYIRVLKVPRNAIMKRSWIFQDSKYTRLLHMQALHKVFSVVLHKPEYALIMLNMLEYLCIYLKKQSSEYVRILNVSSAIHSMRSMSKLRSSYWNRHIQYTVKYLRWSVLQKE